MLAEQAGGKGKERKLEDSLWNNEDLKDCSVVDKPTLHSFFLMLKAGRRLLGSLKVHNKPLIHFTWYNLNKRKYKKSFCLCLPPISLCLFSLSVCLFLSFSLSLSPVDFHKGLYWEWMLSHMILWLCCRLPGELVQVTRASGCRDSGHGNKAGHKSP